MEQCTKTIECGGCPYIDYPHCKTELLKDALRIMEDQEERIAIMTEGKKDEPVIPTLVREGRNKYYNDYLCPVCDQEIGYEQNYCSECGSRVKWDG